MSKLPGNVAAHEITSVARRVLLDGLVALSQHLDALTVVGAQAVYLRTSAVHLPVAAFTSDGDLGVDPARLLEAPLIEDALTDAGFVRLDRNQSGLWFRIEDIGGQEVQVELDLLVGQTLAKTGRRSVSIPPHDSMAARPVPGIETATIDRSPMTVSSLNEEDPRTITVNVAGPAALFVAKAHKLHDRLADADRRPDRLTAKDAGDVYRLMVGTRPNEVGARFAALLTDSWVGPVTRTGLELLRDQFGGSDTPGVRLAIAALDGAVPESRIRALAPAYVRALPTA
ncbi:hypothetical protein ACFORO_17290 [Amycolatopsis halotolerans]|uniref:Uncharacterized protein n=1 Tax=Amycolatopsis halotolerans TaxID=330083 RepID=A0ABV7QK29_9PSEU